MCVKQNKTTTSVLRGFSLRGGIHMSAKGGDVIMIMTVNFHLIIYSSYLMSVYVIVFS